jgi:hypothetical protein
VISSVRFSVKWAAVDSSRQITSAAQTRDRQVPSISQTPSGSLVQGDKDRARRGQHPQGQFNSPIVPEAVNVAGSANPRRVYKIEA